MAPELVKALLKRKGLEYGELHGRDYKAYKEEQYDLLAEELRRHLDMDSIYRIMGVRR